MINKNIFDVMKERKSVRSFTDETISKEDLMMIAEAGRLSPTARNNQLRKFTIIQNKELISRLGKAIGNELKREDYDFYKPNAIILVSVSRDDKSGPVEVGLASQNMWLAATALNLGMVWTNQLRDISDKQAVRQVLNQLDIPSDHICINAMVVGVANEDPEVKERNEEINFID